MPKRTKSHTHANAPSCCSADGRINQRGVFEAAAMLAVATALFALYSRLGSPSYAVEAGSAVRLGAVLLVGVAASVSSCLALVGGLLLSVSAAWCEGREDLSAGAKFVPLALFNLGRLAGYFVLGGAVALVGKSVGLSVQATGYVTIALSLVMLLLGLRILKIVPKSFCRLPLPSRMSERIRGLSTSRNAVAAPLLGALTFFIPCGFTQSVQLLALGSGSFLAGGLIMLTFALGTLPALLGISALSAFSEGTFGRLFFKFSGAVVTLLAIVNLQSGFTLTGITLAARTQAAVATSDPNVSFDENGQQIISMSVTSHGYSPAVFTVKADKPTWIYAVAQDNVSGCASQLTTPAFNMSVAIHKGENWLGPITPQSDFVIACSMGMYRADVHVTRG